MEIEPKTMETLEGEVAPTQELAAHRASRRNKRNRVSSLERPAISESNGRDIAGLPTGTEVSDSQLTQRKLIGESDPAIPNMAASASSSKRCHLDTIPDIYIKLINNRYRPDNSGPFTVQVEKISPPPELQSTIGVLKLGKALLAHVPGHMNSAYDFKRIGQNKFSITFQQYKQANSFVSEMWRLKTGIFATEVWIAYVPYHRITKQMVIRGIDDDTVSPDFILNHIRPPTIWRGHWNGPIDITRLKKRTPDNKDPTNKFVLVDTNIYIASFHNTEITPNAILLGKTIFFSPFIERVRRCVICQRFGHTDKICKAKDKSCVCETCSESGHGKHECHGTVNRCINCIRAKYTETSHKASDPKCLVFLLQRDAKKAMAILGLSPKEALEHVTLHGPVPDGARSKGWSQPVGPPLPTILLPSPS